MGRQWEVSVRSDKDEHHENEEEAAALNDEAVPLFGSVPISVLILFSVFAGIELLLLGGEYGLWGGPLAVGWRSELIQFFGFSDVLFDRMIVSGEFNFEWFYRLFTYPFVAGDFRQVIVGLVLIIGAGKYMAERVLFRTLVIYVLVCVVIGAVAFGVLIDEEQLLSGSYSVGFGLLGYYVYRQYVKARRGDITYFEAFRIPAFIVTLDFTFSFLFGAPWFGVARVAALLAGFAMSLAISWRGTFSWSTLQHRLGRR